jgi:hypothetical protein
MNSVQVIVSAFVANLVAAVQENVLRRALEVVKLSHGLTTVSGSMVRGEYHNVVRNDVGFLLRLESVIAKDARRPEDWRNETAQRIRKLSIRLLEADAQGSRKVRAPRAKQLCPVPGCQGLAAPIFGMVCGEHRNVAKLTIARYRAERRAARAALVQREGGQVARTRRPRAKQFCPVPGCEGVAAPIFGMVCGEHRGVSRQKIARYRAERKKLRAAELSAQPDGQR